MLQISSLIGLMVAGWSAYAGWQRLRGTTLRPAALWLLCSICVCTVVVLSPGNIPAESADQLSLLGALLLLCPPVFGLGARRPVNRVWPWFVMLPMLLAFGLPALTVWRDGWPAVPLELEPPALVGIGLATVMSCGNWLGTRFTLAALLYSLAIGLLAVSVAVAPPDLLADRSVVRDWAGVVLGAAAGFAWLAGRRTSATAAQHDRLWCDFRDTFGMVWARRMMDRVNHTARAQGWTVRLHLDGFRAEGESTATGNTIAEGDTAEEGEAVQYTLGWLLKRFVDDAWVAVRLPQPRTVRSATERLESPADHPAGDRTDLA